MSGSNISLPVRITEKLTQHAPVSVQAREAISKIPYATKTLEPGSYFVREDDLADRIGIILSGFAACQRSIGQGDRQIAAVNIPGDIVGLQNLYLDKSDKNIQALTRCEIATIPSRDLKAVSDRYLPISHTIAINLLIDASILREWLLNIGRRDAYARVAHFLCELAVRIGGSGENVDRSFELPMTQEQLGDALGLTPVHINRMLKRLAKDGLIERDGKKIRLPDWNRIRDVADFSARYLHLDQ